MLEGYYTRSQYSHKNWSVSKISGTTVTWCLMMTEQLKHVITIIWNTVVVLTDIYFYQFPRIDIGYIQSLKLIWPQILYVVTEGFKYAIC